MAMKNAGRISLNSRGNYNSSTKYERLDFVRYNGASYFAKQETTGNAPSSDSAYWQIVSDAVPTVDSTLDDTSSNAISNSAVATALDGKVDVDGSKVLSDENYSTSEKTKLSGIETGAEVNTIESVKVNGTALTPDSDRAVAITIPSTFDASAITSGTIDIERIPQAAMERLVKVADQTARFALTTASVQLGDSVLQLDTGVMYIVINTSALDSGLGYQEYSAGTAASVPWSGVTNKPSSFTPATHTHVMADVMDLDVSDGATYTLVAANWINKTYTLSVTGLTADMNGVIGLSKTATATQVSAAGDARIRLSAQSAGSVTLVAEGDVPSVDIPIDVILLTK